MDLNKEDPNQRDHVEVIYVPTPNKVVDEMLKMAKVGPNDVVWDIGCGDGRLVLMAVEKYGAKRGLGIDISPARIMESQENARLSPKKDRVEFKVGDALKLQTVTILTAPAQLTHLPLAQHHPLVQNHHLLANSLHIAQKVRG